MASKQIHCVGCGKKIWVSDGSGGLYHRGKRDRCIDCRGGNDMKYLFSTNVGSHLWSQNRPDSDIDVYEVYIAPTTDILIGKTFRGGIVSQNELIDKQSFEVGNTITEILKGNHNHILGITSPLIIEVKDEQAYRWILDLTKKSMSKLWFNSIHGLAVHNYSKYIESGKEDTEKKRNTVMRVIEYGITVMLEGRQEFKPVWGATKEEIQSGIKRLEQAYRDSNLPPQPPNFIDMLQFLVNLRLHYYKLESIGEDLR